MERAFDFVAGLGAVAQPSAVLAEVTRNLLGD
jgi:hypothetical protein